MQRTTTPQTEEMWPELLKTLVFTTSSSRPLPLSSSSFHLLSVFTQNRELQKHNHKKFVWKTQFCETLAHNNNNQHPTTTKEKPNGLQTSHDW
jgi:hypothetical protein